MTVAIYGLSTKAVSQLRTHATRLTFVSTSTQYSEFTNLELPYVIPEGLIEEQEKAYKQSLREVHKAYIKLYETIGDKDKSGYLLPQSLRKCLIISGNFPAWQYMLSLRLCNRNTREVQYICEQILQAMTDECGKVWADKCLPNCCTDKCKEGKFCCGHKYQDKRLINKMINTSKNEVIDTSKENNIITIEKGETILEKLSLYDLTKMLRYLKEKHYNDTGADIYLLKDIILNPQSTTVIDLGFGIEVPNGYTAHIQTRTSIAKCGIFIQQCAIDAGYTGELHMIVQNFTNQFITFKAGERLGYLEVFACVYPDFVENLGEERGNGWSGSTNKKE